MRVYNSNPSGYRCAPINVRYGDGGEETEEGG
jgi:hypothetical protein